MSQIGYKNFGNKKTTKHEDYHTFQKKSGKNVWRENYS